MSLGFADGEGPVTVPTDLTVDADGNVHDVAGRYVGRAGEVVVDDSGNAVNAAGEVVGRRVGDIGDVAPREGLLGRIEDRLHLGHHGDAARSVADAAAHAGEPLAGDGLVDPALDTAVAGYRTPGATLESEVLDAGLGGPGVAGAAALAAAGEGAMLGEEPAYDYPADVAEGGRVRDLVDAADGGVGRGAVDRAVRAFDRADDAGFGRVRDVVDNVAGEGRLVGEGRLGRVAEAVGLGGAAATVGALDRERGVLGPDVVRDEAYGGGNEWGEADVTDRLVRDRGLVSERDLVDERGDLVDRAVDDGVSRHDINAAVRAFDRADDAGFVGRVGHVAENLAHLPGEVGLGRTAEVAGLGGVAGAAGLGLAARERLVDGERLVDRERLLDGERLADGERLVEGEGVVDGEAYGVGLTPEARLINDERLAERERLLNEERLANEARVAGYPGDGVVL